ncbi:putative acetolactate synthase large subunit IlvX [Candidatus Sulfopaludibacter sp. SbA6]|nr:putative acetolactate synthase large subunit IlvX [Candidatus Sulfopaludibacter sp. SbA6]
MNGSESLLQTLAANGVDTCFMNPGTSEMRFVAALERVEAVRGVLCLFEGVCAGAADGYARMTGKPAATLLHLGPGLANGLSNLHNARKARSPVINIVGEHSTRHQRYDAPLSADIQAFARTVSGYVRVVARAADMGQAASETIAAAIGPPGQVATLIVPADVSWSEAGGCGPVVARPQRPLPSSETVVSAARLLQLEGPALLLGGTTINDRALAAASKLAARTGACIFADRNAPRIASGRGRFHPHTVPYFPEPAIALLSNIRNLIVVETQAPVSFFGYPETPSYLLPEECAVFALAQKDEDGTGALEALVEECGAARTAVAEAGPEPAPAPDGGPLTTQAIGAALAAWLPESAILSDEMVSAGAAVVPYLVHAAPHDRMPVTGGSIGQGLPVALGAACACPDRKVIALEADGSGMYTLQSLWTMARENLDVVVVIFANRRYQILEIEMRRVGVDALSERLRDSIDIGRPALDWVRLSEGMGVPATRATDGAEFASQLRAALDVRGPRLIEAVLTPEVAYKVFR